ncbi:ABC transporter ATP-binding protein [Bradyrhizobium neotropicale]|uniref:ABC transporter ATP-binding protein n=1 Tax=Bradyrhizobium neotropicale TaxID=1497615 RepID=UPI001AD7C3F1|nr:ABC transporter ATP-binding protein [Bradyrhizobium neotropicale]MBO4227790.1 ATP-binding cassette domain-containing protein [Bradyrhizobium neotropicale]
MMNVLAVRGLRANYGPVPILTGIEFDVGEGEYLGILGQNGMGKTTLLKSLMGHLPATDGVVRFLDGDVTTLPIHARARIGLGLVPQGREILTTLTVRENLRMGLAAARKQDLGVIDDLLTDFPRLVRLLDRPGGALSGAEQQLLAVARCLCAHPKLILLDEPTEGIQPSIIEEIIETLLALRKRRSLSMIVVEQNLEFIASLSDRVLSIQKGRITGEVSREDLLAGRVGLAAT